VRSCWFAEAPIPAVVVAVVAAVAVAVVLVVAVLVPSPQCYYPTKRLWRDVVWREASRMVVPSH
jgi:hypothetical protein